MIACSGMALVGHPKKVVWHWWGSQNGPRPKEEGHYGCLNVSSIGLTTASNY